MSGGFELWRGFRLQADLRARIDSLRPLLETAEVDAIAERRMPLATIEAMKDAGLFRLALAREAGGLALDLVSEMEAYELLARISVTAAWNVLVGNISPLRRDHAARMFASLEERYAEAQPLAPAEVSAFTAAAAYANELATRVANMAFRYGGGDSVRLTSPIQRVLRDLLVTQSHVAAADTSYDGLGKAIIEQASRPSIS